MSDGPHRSLPMRAPWKRVAERADNVAFDVPQITEAMAAAIIPDCRVDITSILLAEVDKITGKQQGELFIQQNLAALEAVKREHAIQPRARDFMDRVVAALSDGKSGAVAIRAALEQTVRQMVSSCIRQIEEFCRRRVAQPHAAIVRTRLEEAATRLVVGDIIQRILTPKGKGQARLTRRKGLDDGVPF